jgi:hypothetical protein
MADTKMLRRPGPPFSAPAWADSGPWNEHRSYESDGRAHSLKKQNWCSASPPRNPSPFPPLGWARQEPERERGVGAAAAAASSATPPAGERVHPRVCASSSSSFATAPLGGGRSERIRWAGKVGCSGALPETRRLWRWWIRRSGTVGRLPSHHKWWPEAPHWRRRWFDNNGHGKRVILTLRVRVPYLISFAFSDSIWTKMNPFTFF